MAPRTRYKQSHATPLHYRLTKDEWLKAVRDLKPRERDILYYLRTLDPFGDSELDIKTRDIAADIGCSPGTVSDALKSLTAKGWIDMLITSARVRLKSSPVDGTTIERSPQRSAIAPTISEEFLDRPNDPVIAPTISDRSNDHAETVVQTEIEALSTEDLFLPKQTDPNCFKNIGTNTVDNWSSTTETMDSKADLVSVISQGMVCIENIAGVPINPPLKAVIEKIAISDPERFKGRIEAAIHAYLEQRPIVRNPQGFISSALQRGFTSNNWKKQQKPINSETPTLTKTNNVPRAAVAAPVNLSGLLIEIQGHCKRLGINAAQALERFGRAGNNLSLLSDIDLATLRSEMVGW